jgi:hypothetical protein
MAAGTHAFILIPGLDPREKGIAAQRLINGLINCTEQGKIEEAGQVKLEGEKASKVIVVYPDGPPAELHIFEAFWGDLTRAEIPDDLSKKVLVRLRNATGLLVYWFFSGVWRAVPHASRYMTGALLFSSLLLVAWYYSVLQVGLTSIGPSENVLLSKLHDWGKGMGVWWVWGIVSLAVGCLPLDEVVDISSFTKRYLQNVAGTDEVGCRDKIRHRMKEVVDEVCGSGNYESVTIVAHSFGTVAAVDLLAGYVPGGNLKLRLVTMGSPLELLGYRSAWVRTETDRCLKNPAISTWYDFYSRDDWMCSKVPGHGSGPGQKSYKQVRECSAMEKLTGKSHKVYYQSQEIMETLTAVPL